MSRNYISCADTAKLIRASLREAFPDVKFSIRSSVYSGGASIRIGWTDGPNQKQVESVADSFCGGYVDGMIDYTGAVYHKLDGIDVHFCANHVFCNRHYSDAVIEACIARVVRKFGGCTPISAADYRNGSAWSWRSSTGIDLGRELSDEMGKRSDRLFIGASPTLARVAFAGDDGYGAGTVGNGDGVTWKGYPKVA